MKTTLIFGLLGLGIALIACEKENNFGHASIRVNAVLDDPLDVSGQNQPYASEKVYIKKSSDSLYLFESKTDSNGIVSFSLLKENEEYTIYAMKENNGIPYYGEIRFKANEVAETTLTISPQYTKFNGFRIKCVDSQGAGIPQADICIFESQFLADSADCDVSTFKGTSDAFGYYSKLNIPAKTYYISIVDTIAGFPVSEQLQFTQSSTGLEEIVVVVIP